MSKFGRPRIEGNMLANDKNVIIYRKELNKLTGSVTASLLLKQAMYWDKIKGGKFYKFISPCNHDLYKEGDSWLEELGFSKHEFRSAIKKIGFKRGKSKNEIENEKDAYIIYYTNSDRVTYWMVNWKKLNKDLKKLYRDTDYLVNPESGNTKSNRNPDISKETGKREYPSSETTPENNTEASKQLPAETVSKLTNLLNRSIKKNEIDNLIGYKVKYIDKAIKRIKKRNINIKSANYLIPIIEDIKEEEKKMECTVDDDEIEEYINSL